MFSFSPKTNKHNAASPHSFIPPGMAGWFHAHTPMHKARFLLLWPVLSPLPSASCLQPLISGDLPCSSAVTQVVPEALRSPSLSSEVFISHQKALAFSYPLASLSQHHRPVPSLLAVPS